MQAIDFTTEATLWKLQIDEKKYYPTLFIKTDLWSDTIRNKYYLSFIPNIYHYEQEEDSVREQFKTKLEKSLFPGEAEERLDEKLSSIIERKEKYIEEHPELKFWWELIKYEDKWKDEQWYERTFKVSEQTAIAIIASKSKFHNYICEFRKRDTVQEQEITTVQTTITN